jgi:hypothetical protein
MANIDILISSVRNHRPSIDSAIAAAKRSPYSFKIYLTSPTPPTIEQAPHVVYVEEKEQEGSVAAYNRLGRLSESEFILTFTDALCFTDTSLNLVETLRKIRAADNKLVTASYSINDSPPPFPLAGAGYGWPGQDKVREMLGDSHLVRCQCFDRQSFIEDFDSHIHNPYFYHHACDCWLSAFCYFMGYPRHEDTTSVINHCNPHQTITIYDERDSAVFAKLCLGFHRHRSYIANPDDQV